MKSEMILMKEFLDPSIFGTFFMYAFQINFNFED